MGGPGFRRGSESHWQDELADRWFDDRCLLGPPALSAKEEGFNVVALMDTSAACTKIGAQNSRDLLLATEIELMTVIPMITSIISGTTRTLPLGSFTPRPVKRVSITPSPRATSANIATGTLVVSAV
ncbi:hypothetical protein [Acidithrix sp. C25]|uniref:hypothetical protein n=1 Tax=Acidithrix sp. C25 TaxID=1671482 RepID=UPI00191BA88C|nr:hypothetical protein [Acidithrix sp. C25]